MEALRLEGSKGFFEDVSALEFDLLELGGAKDKIKGEGFVELALGDNCRVNLQLEGMAIGLLAEGAAARGEGTGVNEMSDAGSEIRFVAVFADDGAQGFKMGFFGFAQILACGPFRDTANGEIAGMDAVHDIVERVGGVIGPIHDLAFDALELVEGFGFL